MVAFAHNEFIFSFPSGWVDASQIVMLGPESKEFRSSLVMTTGPHKSGMSVDEVAALQLKVLEKEVPEFKLVKQGTAKLGPHTGILREFTLTGAGKKLGQLQFVLINAEKVVTLTYTELQARMAMSRPMVTDILGKMMIRDLSK